MYKGKRKGNRNTTKNQDKENKCDAEPTQPASSPQKSQATPKPQSEPAPVATPPTSCPFTSSSESPFYSTSSSSETSTSYASTPSTSAKTPSSYSSNSSKSSGARQFFACLSLCLESKYDEARELLDKIDKSRVSVDVDQLVEWIIVCKQGAAEFKQSLFEEGAASFWQACVIMSQLEPRDNKKIRDLRVKSLRNRVRCLKKLPTRQLEALSAVDMALELQRNDASLLWLRGLILSGIYLWNEAAESLKKAKRFSSSESDKSEISLLTTQYLRHSKEQDFYYDIFGDSNVSASSFRELDDEAFGKQLKRRYRKLSLLWHPDKVLCHVGEYMSEESARNYACSVFKIINNAHEVLSNYEERLAYNRKTKSAPSPTQTRYSGSYQSYQSPWHETSYSSSSTKPRKFGDCWNWQESGYCRFGSSCRYSHDVHTRNNAFDSDPDERAYEDDGYYEDWDDLY